MNQNMTNAIQALRDKADWLESLPESKQDELEWDVSERQSLSLYAHSTESAWRMRALISGPNVTKVVNDYGTVWTRKVTEHFSLRLTLPRASTCKPVMETEVHYETVDADSISWDADNQCWIQAVKTQKRVGWDCGDTDTP